jgi:hypothetical protein
MLKESRCFLVQDLVTALPLANGHGNITSHFGESSVYTLDRSSLALWLSWRACPRASLCWPLLPPPRDAASHAHYASRPWASSVDVSVDRPLRTVNIASMSWAMSYLASHRPTHGLVVASLVWSSPKCTVLGVPVRNFSSWNLLFHIWTLLFRFYLFEVIHLLI